MTNIDVGSIEKARNVRLGAILGLPEGYMRKVRCPFHSEKTPSCTIFADNHWHCFGCGKHGKNAIDFLMALDYSFMEAVNELLKI